MDKIYLDNNATTMMPVHVQKEFLRWCNKGNPSSGHADAKKIRDMMNKYREYVGSICGVDTCCMEPRDDPGDIKSSAVARCDENRYKVIFTSGASESNSTVFSTIVMAARLAHGGVPHVVVAANEHKSLIEIARDYEARGLATISFVDPMKSGHIHPDSILRAIGPRTCLICVMSANNETGAINDVRAIGEIAHRHGIPYHCDTVQTFGKLPLNPITCNIDSMTASAHKFHGPPGTGLLIIKQKLLLGYRLPQLIYGTQNDGYRGGTENVPGIGAAFAALRYTLADRGTKNANMRLRKRELIDALMANFLVSTYAEYVARGPKASLQIVLFDDNLRAYLPNTLLLAVVKTDPPAFCNSKLRVRMEAEGVIVSVGSACNTASRKASHVLYSMGADKLVRAGTIRISIGDQTTSDDIRACIRAFVTAVYEQT